MEKEATTPETYPLSLNALMRACNQRSNRHPIMELEEVTVRHALDRLIDLKLVRRVISDDGRVPKFRHIVPEVLELQPPEAAAIAVLLLRGPQTPGEIRGRSERLFDFGGLAAVEATLDDLGKREDPLVVRLERTPGTKEYRYAHLLSGEIQVPTVSAIPAAVPASPVTKVGVAADVGSDRVTELEAEVAELRDEVKNLKKRFEDFSNQFE
jgi:uncharacterized protein YceH (UPF0502 family)